MDSLRLRAEVLLRYRYLVLVLVMAELYVAGLLVRGGIDDWQFFDWGSQMLFGQHGPLVRPGSSEDLHTGAPGGFHVYGNYKFLQIGPPALLVARLTALGPGDGRPVALALIGALGLLSIYCLDRAFRPVRGLLLAGGALVVLAWAPLMRSGHLDDALALTGFAAAAWMLQARRPAAAGLCLGLAAASKPWAVVLLPLVLLLPGARARLGSLALASAVILASWGPFILADPETLKLGQESRELGSGTALEALGWYPTTQTLRLTQFLGGAALVALLVLRRRWELAPLAAFSLRLLLEINAVSYYSAATILAAFLADVVQRRRLPTLTILVTAVSVAAGSARSHEGSVRLALYVGLVALALAAAARRSRAADAGDWRASPARPASPKRPQNQTDADELGSVRTAARPL